MLNLLPEEHKKKIVGEYTKRVWTVVLGGMIGLVFISGIFFLPVYLMSRGVYTEALKAQVDIDNRIAASEKNAGGGSIKDVQGTINALDHFNRPSAASVLIQAVVLDKPAGIILGHIVYTPSNTSPSTLDVSGKAATRSSLVNFSERLKADGSFGSVYIPISSFTKEKDIAFTVKLVASSTLSI